MKHYYNIFLLAFLIPLVAVANDGKFKGKHTKEKKEHKEFVVNTNAGLKIDNQYGNVDIVTWNENKIVIDVVIKANGNDEERVQERLEAISVDFSGTGSKVSAVTQFKSNKSKWSSWFGSSKGNVSIEVNYTVKLPITNTVDINNDYGTVSIDRLQGNAKINCDYGQLLLGELMADDNLLNFDHTNKSTIQYMKSGKINADYSNFKLLKSDRLDLTADHSSSKIMDINTLHYNNDYGSIEVDNANMVVGRGDHISHTFGSVSGALNINNDYGSITVDRLEKTCKSVIIKAEYASIKLGLASGYSFDVELHMTYGNMKGEELFEFANKRIDGSDQFYSGHFGAKASGNKVNINSTYGGITFKRL